MKRTGLLLLALVFGLGALGIGYAHWSQTLFIEGSVATGTYCIGFIDRRTNDPCVAPGKPGALIPTQDDPKILVPLYDGMLDWGIPVPGEPKCPDYDGNLKPCYQTMKVFMHNIYPGYHGVFRYRIGNCGTVPGQVIGAKIVAIGGVELVAPISLPKCTETPCQTGEVVPVDLDGDGKLDVNMMFFGPVDQQIDPCQPKEFRLMVHVRQGAPQLKTLTFTIEIETIQWNEYTP